MRWWIQGTPLPPLATSSPAGTAQASAGVAGVNGTTVLFGQRDVNDDSRNGGRDSTEAMDSGRLADGREVRRLNALVKEAQLLATPLVRFYIWQDGGGHLGPPSIQQILNRH